MSTINRKYGDGRKLKFLIDLTDYPGKTDGDIDDIFFSVKNSQSDADVDSLLFKTKGASQITHTPQTDPLFIDVLVEWLGTEYSNMTVGETYLAGLFVKWTGEDMADENVEGDGIYKIKIVQDFLHEN